MSDFDHSMRMLERGDTLPAAVAQSAMALVMRGGVSTESLTEWLRLLSTRTPTADELLGCTEAFMAHAVRVPTRTTPDRIVDTCGTGGAPKVFNASTLSALLVAAAGAPVAKHGNRSRTGFGSAETLEALGVDLSASPQAQADHLDRHGFCFCMAPRHHPGAAHAVAARKAIVGPTIFNAIGPLCNPAGAQRRLLGVWDARLMQPMAQVLARRGAVHALVLHSRDGLDEISLCTETDHVRVVDGAVMETGTLTPESFGMKRRSEPPTPAGNLPGAVQLSRTLLAGTCTSAHVDMLVVNAAAALVVAGRCGNWVEGAEMARSLLADGAGLALLQRLI